MATFPPALLQRLIAVVDTAYPGWTDFSDERLERDEIEYKQRTIAKASTRLSESALRGILERGEYETLGAHLLELGRDNNLLYRGVPRSGDLGILHVSSLPQKEFAKAFFDLLHGPGTSPERLQRYSDWVAQRGLPNKWTFPTYFLFLSRPDAEVFVKPTLIKQFLKLAAPELELGSTPTAAVYGELLDILAALREGLAAYKPRDMVDLQSFVWVATRMGYEMGVQTLDATRERTLRDLIDEFGESYVLTDAFKDHKTKYRLGRDAARRNFDEVLAAKDRGEDITDRVLLTFLPHSDTEANRAKGAWVHVAPAITGDVRGWFENKGWTEPDAWPFVAGAILSFVARVVEDPAELEAACQDFSDSPYTKGLQTGMVTPFLNSLAPEHFLLANSKSRAVINHFLGLKMSGSLIDYPAFNQAERFLVRRLQDRLERVLPEDVRVDDGFDAFCHWLVAIKSYSFGRDQAWKISVDPSAWSRWVEEGVAGLSQEELGDVAGLSKKAWATERETALRVHPEVSGDALDEVRTLAHSVHQGDVIIAAHGIDRVLGIGVVVGSYQHNEDDEDPHRVSVEWTDTRSRAVSQPGWRKGRLLSLARKEAAALRDLPPAAEAHGEALFTDQTFSLLSALHASPTRDFYAAHQRELHEHVEAPLQTLLRGIAGLLPPAMKESLETEKRLFSRIVKNDWGRGGAWDFYWGAFYTKGGKRIADAQLYVWLNRERLEYGFYIGDYAEEPRDRFLANARKRREALTPILGPTLAGRGLLFGAQHDEEHALRVEEASSTFATWLEQVDVPTISVRGVVDRARALQMSESDLRDLVLEDFRRLFPLVLLANADDPLAAISDFLETEVDEEEELQPEYSLDECAQETGVDLETLQSWVEAIERKKQAILYGPPGTGKTHLARALARNLVQKGDGFIELVQFHPAYAYEDFIQGIRPLTRTDGQLEYQMVLGRFLEFCRRAQTRSGTCVLIIDEINRANLARVFGELMYLLEYRDEEVPLAGGGKLRIPKNLRILGTMNTADRSIALVDHALRRRFAFLHLRPNFEILERFHDAYGRSVAGLVDKLVEMNQAIGDESYHVGITFFLVEKLEDHLESIWRMEIEPYLEEYFFDEGTTVDRFRWERVSEQVLGD